MISYKYNIYHSKKTKYLDKMLRECCFVWNHALALQRRYHKLFGKYISVGKMKKHFAKRIRRNLLHSQTTQEILERLDESYNRFFKKLAKRPPKFKSPEKFNSFVFKQGGFTLNGNCLTINKGNKRFRFSYSRGYEGNVKQIRIVRETCSRFSLIVVTDHNPISSYRKTHDGASIVAMGVCQTGNCIIQLNVNPKDPSESFFDVYDRDEMKLIYGIKINILKEMFII